MKILFGILVTLVVYTVVVLPTIIVCKLTMWPALLISVLLGRTVGHWINENLDPRRGK